MNLRRLAIIGAGGMAEVVLRAVAEGLPQPLEHVALLASPEAQESAAALLERIGPKLAENRVVRASWPALLADLPEVFVECAGHSAVHQYGALALESGRDFVAISTGALADETLLATLLQIAARRGVRLVLPAGAVGGIDALAAARLSGLQAVTYTGTKPPAAWRGTPAEQSCDLDGLKAPATIFEGSAREAAAAYPQNANVAATIALAGLGFDATRVRLVADPAAICNTHEVSVRAACGDFEFRLQGRPSPFNPKTSLTAGYSLAREILNRCGALVV